MPVTSPNRPAAGRAGTTYPSGVSGISGMFGTRIMAALATMFNFLALNLVLVIASLPVVTAPAALNAAMVALDQWRGEGEDRVVTEFALALRSRPPLRTTLLTGVPLAAVVLGLAEVHHFVRGGSLTDRAYLGIGLGALVITLMALGYVFLLAAREPALPPTELWSLCAALAIRNLLVTGPLFLIEIAGVTAITVIDPALLLLGTPLLLLVLMRLTAQLGLRRSEQSRAERCRAEP